jgi:hypothetical protein
MGNAVQSFGCGQYIMKGGQSLQHEIYSIEPKFVIV